MGPRIASSPRRGTPFPPAINPPPSPAPSRPPKGFERAMAARVDEVAIFAATTYPNQSTRPPSPAPSRPPKGL
jgi:hypothetical protein